MLPVGSIFAGLTLLYAVLLALPAVLKKLGTRRFVLVANVDFLVLTLGGSLVLVNAVYRARLGAVMKEHGVARGDVSGGEASNAEQLVSRTAVRS